MNSITIRKIHFACLLLLLILPLHAAMAKETDRLKAVLFYPGFCAECTAVIDDFLVPLSMERDKELELFPIDITEAPGDTIFRKALDRFGEQPDAWSRPAVLVGDKMLRGQQEIMDSLPALLNGADNSAFRSWPQLPGLQQLINGEDVAGQEAAATDHNDSIATALAWLVMFGMLLSLGFTGKRLKCNIQRVSFSPALRSWLPPLLALAGLAIGIYLTSVALTQHEIMCGPIGDCMSVQTSPHAKLFGMPMSLWGIVFYLSISLLWLLQRFNTGRAEKPAALALLLLSVFGVMFSVYLTHLELFVIHAVCIWCLTSAVLATLIMLSIGRELRKHELPA